jgi:adenylate kinase
MPMEPQFVLMFGGPGAGKGTQAHLLSAALGVPHISSGDLLRLHAQGRELMQRGDLLPDDVATEAVLNRLEEPDAARGAILDGFPRTLAQAQRLDKWLQQRGGAVRAAVYLEVPRDDLVARLVSRGLVSQRDDDRADVADRRVDVFLEELPPVLNHYAARGLLRRIDGARPVDRVRDEIIQALQPAVPPDRS